MIPPRQTTLDDVLAAVVALDAKLDALFKRLEPGDGLTAAAMATGQEVTLAELVPLMPKGLRSRASIFRLLSDRAISGRKVRGTWTFKPSKVLADLNHFERVSSVSAFTCDQMRKTTRRKKRNLGAPQPTH